MKIYQDSRFICSGKYVICITDVVVDFGILGEQAEFTVRGKARCADDDEFDFSVGKRLAETRASMKVYSRVARMYRDILNEMERTVNTVAEDADRVEYLFYKEVDHMKELKSKF